MQSRKCFELGNFQTSAPTYRASQATTFEWLREAYAKALVLDGGATQSSPDGGATQSSPDMGATSPEIRSPQNVRDRLQRFGCKPTQIAFREFDTVNMTNHNFDGPGLFTFKESAALPQARAHMSLLGERSLFFAKRSLEVFQDLYPVNAESPNHIIHVSCTGYNSPSAPQRLVDLNDWNDKTAVTHAYHMGCYAAMPAIRMAMGTFTGDGAAEPSGQTDIVHTEMCSLHMNPTDPAPDQMVINTLFADGHIKYSVAPEGSMGKGFRVLTIRERIVKDSAEDMTWVPHEWGFKMGLSREVPRKIGENIRAFLIHLAERAQCDLADLLRNATFAIHPGGPRIITSIQEILELRDEQTADSKKILFERGNMSSATLPHVWQRISAGDPKSGHMIVSLAFGPGLTIFGSVFEVI